MDWLDLLAVQGALKSLLQHHWGGSREELPPDQKTVAVWLQESREELLHVQGQEGQPWGDTPRLM